MEADEFSVDKSNSLTLKMRKDLNSDYQLVNIAKGKNNKTRLPIRRHG